MSVKQLFKKVLIPCAAGVGLTSDGHTLGPNCTKRPETKPSQLPIYSSECTVCGVVSKKPQPPSPLEEAVSSVRKELWVWQDNLKGYRHKFVDVYQSSFSKANSAIDYLREETHGPERAGAIVLSGLTGYILGLRKGIIRRLFYTSLGALGMAAICYPNDAAVYTDEALQEGKRYFIIAYHFIYGDPDKIERIAEVEFSGNGLVGDYLAKKLIGNGGMSDNCTCNFDPENPKPCTYFEQNMKKPCMLKKNK